MSALLQPTTFFLSDRTIAAFSSAARILKPPPKLTLTEWAERNIWLSSEDSATAGPYRVKIAPYQRGMQDAVLEPGVRSVTFWTSAQIGKTQILKNILGYFAKEDPSPIIFMLPDLELAKRVSQQRIAPMFRDSPGLRGLLVEGARKSGNATLSKSFPGGQLFMVGSNAPAAMSSVPARISLSDELDRCARSAGPEGNPLLLLRKRQTTFWNALEVKASTCTIEGDSPIEGEYSLTDRGKFWVPCPHCGEFQVLEWEKLLFPKDEEPTVENTVYACKGCGVALTEFDKPRMLAGGEWRSERPEIRAHRGFWINELYSPFVAWHQMARDFRENWGSRDPEKRKTFWNLSLARTWRDDVKAVEGNTLMERREDYPPPALPDRVIVVTAGIDVQEDRLEVEVVGWGMGEESWSIDKMRFYGDTAIMQGPKNEDNTPAGDPSAWEKLEKFLLETRYLHARGVRLEIAASMVDSGFRANEVYQFTRRMQGKHGARCFASKGMTGWSRPPLSPYNRNNKLRVRMYPVGVDVLKRTTYDRMKLTTPGAGYMHFSKEKNDHEYFEQLTAEVIDRKYVHGYPVRFWKKKSPAARNEMLDCRVYATAAFYTLSENPAGMLEGLRKKLLEKARYAAAERRAHVPSGQLPLIDGAAPVPAVSTPGGNAKEDRTPAQDFGDQEFKVAEQEPALPPKPQEKPVVIVRRGGWL